MFAIIFYLVSSCTKLRLLVSPKSVKIFLFITQIFYCFENRQILNFDSVTFRITPNAPGQANQPYTDCYLWLWLSITNIVVTGGN